MYQILKHARAEPSQLDPSTVFLSPEALERIKPVAQKAAEQEAAGPSFFWVALMWAFGSLTFGGMCSCKSVIASFSKFRLMCFPLWRVTAIFTVLLFPPCRSEVAYLFRHSRPYTSGMMLSTRTCVVRGGLRPRFCRPPSTAMSMSFDDVPDRVENLLDNPQRTRGMR